MLEEARAAESKRDFISKCSIGLKPIRRRPATSYFKTIPNS